MVGEVFARPRPLGYGKTQRTGKMLRVPGAAQTAQRTPAGLPQFPHLWLAADPPTRSATARNPAQRRESTRESGVTDGTCSDSTGDYRFGSRERAPPLSLGPAPAPDWRESRMLLPLAPGSPAFSASVTGPERPQKRVSLVPGWLERPLALCSSIGNVARRLSGSRRVTWS